MSRTTHDSPYRDDSSPRAAPSRNTSSRPARKSHHPRTQDHPRKSQPTHAPPSANGSRGAHAATAAPSTAQKAPGRRSRRSRRGNGSGAPTLQLTSHPTGRAAYADTRAWLLKQHGAICAYCAREFTPQVMTLDHVAPRRGQTAYDRRDNLVLACRGCNEAKRDLSPLAYLLAVRSRAGNLLRYGAHLSPGLLDLARSLMPKDDHATAHEGNGSHATRPTFGGGDADEESPYKD